MLDCGRLRGGLPCGTDKCGQQIQQRRSRLRYHRGALAEYPATDRRGRLVVVVPNGEERLNRTGRHANIISSD
jgi:hypothetical protein